MSIFTPQPLPVTTTDRMINNIPVTAASNPATLNADRVMNALDKILSGQYRNGEHIWSYLGVLPNDRPSLTSSPAVIIGEKGFNTDFNGVEIYTGPGYGWLVVSGVWDDSTRPHETSPGASDLAPGSKGFNVTSGKYEYWDGSAWKAFLS